MYCLCRFDERISCFAETKFQRDGIEVLTGCRVVSVSEHSVNMKVKSTGEYVVVPHGMVVWSTGVGTRPFVRNFMEEIGQVRLHYDPPLCLSIVLLSTNKAPDELWLPRVGSLCSTELVAFDLELYIHLHHKLGTYNKDKLIRLWFLYY